MLRATALLILGCSAIAAVPQAGLRTIFVTVVDRKGMPVAGLTSVDFTVKEDGRARPIDLAKTEIGSLEVERVILALEHGVFV